MEIKIKLTWQLIRGATDTIKLAQDVFRVCRGEGSHNLQSGFLVTSKAQPMDGRRSGGLIPASLVVVKAKAYLTKPWLNGTGRRRWRGTGM